MQVLLTWLWYLDFGANLALLASLAWNGLYRIYRFFFAYLAADVLESLGGLLFQKSYRIYGEIYFAGQSIKMLLAVFVVLEIYRIALAGRPALARFGRETVSYVPDRGGGDCGLRNDDRQLRAAGTVAGFASVQFI